MILTIRKFILALLLCTTGYPGVFAKIKLPAQFSDHMVLQRESDVAFWGTASPGSGVVIRPSWTDAEFQVKAGDDGKWRVMVKTPEAGGPYEILLDDGEELRIKDVLIGEVWVCSGQSNMEMPVRGFHNQPVLGSTEILLNAYNSKLRLFRLERETAAAPLENREASWEKASPAHVKEFSAVGYWFAKILQENLQVPVGIIQTTWGGTRIEAWMSREALQAFPEIEIKTYREGEQPDRNDPTALYNGMVNSLAGFRVSGVIWYQGEGNRSQPLLYEKLMPAMVADWRSKWGNASWSFYYVQIAPYLYRDYRELVPLLRESQAKALQQIPRSGMVVSVDVGDEHTIHPPDKKTIGGRLACQALAKTYGWESIPCESPVYQNMKTTGDTVYIRFDHAPGGLSTFGKELRGFEVAGKDRVFHPAGARIVREGVELHSEKVPDPVAVRYCFKDWQEGTLYNTDGLPAAPFRTDDWEVK